MNYFTNKHNFHGEEEKQKILITRVHISRGHCNDGRTDRNTFGDLGRISDRFEDSYNLILSS